MRKRKRDAKTQPQNVTLKRHRELDPEEKVRFLRDSRYGGSESDTEEEEEEEWRGAESETEMDESDDLADGASESPSGGAGLGTSFEFLPPGGEVSQADVQLIRDIVLGEFQNYEGLLSQFAGSLDQLFGVSQADVPTIDTALGQAAGFERVTAGTVATGSVRADEEEEEEEVYGTPSTGREFTPWPVGEAGTRVSDQERSPVEESPRLETTIQDVESFYVDHTARETAGDGLTELLGEVIAELTSQFPDDPPEELRLILLSSSSFTAALEHVKGLAIGYLTAKISEILELPGMAEE